MSNYYISNCCQAQVEITNIEDETGICLDCKEQCELEAVIDDNINLNKED